jgi:mannose-6-phosphate isomerase-like protein (cupin superfamily)
MDDPIKVLIRSEDGAGGLALIDEYVESDFVGPPLHLHPDFDEAFYVLEGELTFRLRNEYVTAGPGELVFAPRGVPHTFANLSDAPARQLIVCTPAGFERYFARMAAERNGTEPPEWAAGPIPEVVTVGQPIDPSARQR